MLFVALLAAFQVHYDVSEFVNAVYHVSCLTGRVPCSSEVYTHFWKEIPGGPSKDERYLNQWASIFDRAENKAGPSPSADLLPNFPSFYPSLRVRQQLLAAAIQGGSPEGLRRLAQPLVGKENAAALAGVIQYTLGRLHPWYIAKAPGVRRRLKVIQMHGKSNTSVAVLAGMTRFVRADSDFRQTSVHLIPSPDPAGNAASATAVRNHAFLELTDSMPPQGAASVVVHELTHAAYDSASLADQQKLISQFSATNNTSAPAMYGLLNEAMATGIQLLLNGPEKASDEDVYRHPYIPRAGRATAPVLREALSHRSTMLDGFVRDYISAMAKEVGTESTLPRFQLLTAGVLASVKNKAAQDQFIDKFHMVGACRTEQELALYANLPVVRLITFDEADATRGIANFDLLATHRAFVLREPMSRPSFLIAGRNPEALNRAIDALLTTTDHSTSGVILTLD